MQKFVVLSVHNGTQCIVIGEKNNGVFSFQHMSVFKRSRLRHCSEQGVSLKKNEELHEVIPGMTKNMHLRGLVLLGHMESL